MNYASGEGGRETRIKKKVGIIQMGRVFRFRGVRVHRHGCDKTMCDFNIPNALDKFSFGILSYKIAYVRENCVSDDRVPNVRHSHVVFLKFSTAIFKNCFSLQNNCTELKRFTYFYLSFISLCHWRVSK